MSDLGNIFMMIQLTNNDICKCNIEIDKCVSKSACIPMQSENICVFVCDV